MGIVDRKDGRGTMGLQPRLFRGDPKLEACLVNDDAHVKQGAVGGHVLKVQQALLALREGRFIPPSIRAEVAMRLYGPATAAVVLVYKTSRRIIGVSYQTKPDNIVGKMTIAALDKEMAAAEKISPLKRLTRLQLVQRHLEELRVLDEAKSQMKRGPGGPSRPDEKARRVLVGRRRAV
jgi:hypothetical protein